MVINVNTINFYSNLIHCHVLCMVCSCDVLGVALSVEDKWLHSTYVLNTTICRYFMQEVRILWFVITGYMSFCCNNVAKELA